MIVISAGYFALMAPSLLRSKAVVLFSLISFFIVAHIVGLGFCVWSLLCCAKLTVLPSFAIILLGKRELVALLK